MLKIPNFSDLKVAVIGDIMLDEYYDCTVDRISPEAPVMVCKTDQSKRTITLGGAGNVALNCKRLGSEVHLYGILGSDEYGNAIHRICNSEKILCLTKDGVIINTICKTRYRKGHNQIIRIDYENSDLPYEHDKYNNNYNLQNKLFEDFKSYINNYNLVILSDYNKGTLNEQLCIDIIDLCIKHNIPVYIDPKGYDWEKYSGATCLTPNLKEFHDLISDDPLDKYKELIKEIVYDAQETLDIYNLKSILITKGKYGMSYIDRERDFHYKKDTQEVFDVSGAGDTVISTFAMARIKGYDYKDAVILADLAAKTVIRKSGTYAISIEELTEEINKYNLQYESKFITTDKKLTPEEIEKLRKECYLRYINKKEGDLY